MFAMKIIAFAGSNSRDSINKQLVTYAANLFENAHVEVLNLNDFELPLYSKEREKVLGQPQLAKEFLKKLGSADLIVLSLAENNGNYSAAFKNIFDWCSRIDVKVFQNKPMLLMATSPGKRGGQSVLEIAQSNLPRYGADIKNIFSLPLFEENFDTKTGAITNQDLDNQLKEIIKNLSL